MRPFNYPSQQSLHNNFISGLFKLSNSFKKMFFMLPLLLLLLVSSAIAQIDPGDPVNLCPQSCLNGSLNISTGFDQNSATYQTPLATESNWTLIAAPPSASITFPAPCYDITPNGAWSSFPNAQWVSPFQNNAYSTNNCPPAVGNAFTFEKCFCVCRPTSLRFLFDMLVDDGGIVYLDGVPIASAMLGYQFQWNNRLQVDTTILVSAGRHCLTVDLHNCGAVAMGFALEGTITGFDLLTPACCTPEARICGTKVNDANCDGIINPAIDLGVAGFVIELRDALNNVIATAITDAAGNYCFSPLAPGVYTVSEVNQAGWTQTFPTTPGTHTINLLAGGVATANFGNCQSIVIPPCDFSLDFAYSITDCQATFNSNIISIPTGYQVVSSVWTFGDGYSATNLNPVHYYTNTGTFTVCLTVTISNGTECCTKTFCKDITIDRKCDDGCKFDADIDYTVNDKCLYNFNLNVYFAGLPISNIFWDFGDGTYANGSNVNHQYLYNGVYTVCATIIAYNKEECCMVKICKTVEVNCACDRKPNDGTGLNIRKAQGKLEFISDKPLIGNNVVVLDQNVPNPFAESTVINYQINKSFSSAKIIFTNAEGKIIKEMEIKEKGTGSITVYGNNLKSGTYLYSLIIDGRRTESKRLIKE